jgi:hypothetical protein
MNVTMTLLDGILAKETFVHSIGGITNPPNSQILGVKKTLQRLFIKSQDRTTFIQTLRACLVVRLWHNKNSLNYWKFQVIYGKGSLACVGIMETWFIPEKE